MFIIQARNAEGANRTTGGDEFEVKIKRLDITVPEDEVLDAKKQKAFDQLPEEERKKILDAKAAKKQAIIDKINVKPKIIDNEDGTYTVRYKVPE